MGEVNENLASAWFGGVDLLDLGGDAAGLVINDGLVARGDFRGCHIDVDVV